LTVASGTAVTFDRPGAFHNTVTLHAQSVISSMGRDRSDGWTEDKSQWDLFGSYSPLGSGFSYGDEKTPMANLLKNAKIHFYEAGEYDKSENIDEADGYLDPWAVREAILLGSGQDRDFKIPGTGYCFGWLCPHYYHEDGQKNAQFINISAGTPVAKDQLKEITQAANQSLYLTLNERPRKIPVLFPIGNNPKKINQETIGTDVISVFGTHFGDFGENEFGQEDHRDATIAESSSFPTQDVNCPVGAPMTQFVQNSTSSVYKGEVRGEIVSTWTASTSLATALVSGTVGLIQMMHLPGESGSDNYWGTKKICQALREGASTHVAVERLDEQPTVDAEGAILYTAKHFLGQKLEPVTKRFKKENELHKEDIHLKELGGGLGELDSSGVIIYPE
jgi:hypothetical protein